MRAGLILGLSGGAVAAAVAAVAISVVSESPPPVEAPERSAAAASTADAPGDASGAPAASGEGFVVADVARPDPARGAIPPAPTAPEAGGAGEPGEPGAPLRVSRNELDRFADLVASAAGSPAIAPGSPGLAAAPAAIPPPTELINGLDDPVFAAAIPGDERIFIVEQAGRIQILQRDGSLAATPFLDITSQVNSSADETGLLGLAFAPDHATSRAFYVYYTAGSNPLRSVVSRFKVLAADPSRTAPNSEQIIIEVDQTNNNHNGGTIAFRPNEPDNLFFGLGDGGSANDPPNNAQNPQVLLGKMLRLDVSDGVAGYSIPADNPFVGNANDPGDQVLDEIWALGLRNPYRFSFDADTGDLWIGDVGQNDFEEVDFEPPGNGGRNYQWKRLEGNLLVAPGTLLGPGDSTAPEIVYPHVGSNCTGSVTGGIVYRGPETDLQGFYFFADFCQDLVWSYDEPVDDRDDQTVGFGPAATKVVAFGEDGAGGMLVVRRNGQLYRVGATGDDCDDGIDNDGDGSIDHVADTGCVDSDDPSELDPDSPCDDGIDNDGDGDIDFPDDLSCASADDVGEIAGNDECSNGIDDDGDTKIDFPDDAGCADANDASELDPTVECDDGLDNDGDGDIDFPNDAGCNDEADGDEASSGDDDGGGGDCGLGFELVLLIPVWSWARRRLRRRPAA